MTKIPKIDSVLNKIIAGLFSGAITFFFGAVVAHAEGSSHCKNSFKAGDEVYATPLAKTMIHRENVQIQIPDECDEIPMGVGKILQVNEDGSFQFQHQSEYKNSENKKERKKDPSGMEIACNNDVTLKGFSSYSASCREQGKFLKRNDACPYVGKNRALKDRNNDLQGEGKIMEVYGNCDGKNGENKIIMRLGDGRTLYTEFSSLEDPSQKKPSRKTLTKKIATPAVSDQVPGSGIIINRYQ